MPQEFIRPTEYQRVMPLIEKVNDVYDGLYLDEIRAKYLIQRSSEPTDAYNVRLRSSRLENRFRASIDSYAGLLSEFDIFDAPPMMAESFSDIDQRGNNLQLWSARADIKMLRDGQCLVGVDFPVSLAADARRGSNRPYLVAIDFEDIYQPITSVVDGRVVLEEITIRRNYSINAEGDRVSEYWRYIANEQGHQMPTRVEVYAEQISDSSTGRSPLALDREYPILDAAQRPLGRVPFVWYSASPDSEPMMPDYPPFLSLCDLNIAHMGKESELDDVETTSNRPTPLRKWPKAVPDSPPPVRLGQNGCIELPQGASMEFLEVKGEAIAITHQRQLSREQRMDREDQKFLGGGQNAKTATQVLLETAQSRMSFRLLVGRKESVMEEVFKLWRQFSDPNFDLQTQAAGYIQISDASVVAPPSSQDVQQVFQGFSQGVYDRDVAQAKLKEMGWWPEELVSDIQKSTVETEENAVPTGRQNEDLDLPEIEPGTAQ